ncbi:MAG: tetratricopeptide repeat protein [Pyrinomonadaceae bacterium]
MLTSIRTTPLALASTRLYFFASVLLLSLTSLASAQAVGSTRGLTTGEGNNTIQGRIYLPAGEGGKILKVTLESEQDVGGQSTASDQDGVFRFNSLRPGRYTVVVSGGKDFQDARESVTIDPLGSSRVAQITIQMRARIDAANPAFAGVPQATLDLYQKGSTAAQKGDAKGAVEFLSKAVTASPSFTMALSDLGSQYLKLFQWSKAEETFEALIKLKPADAGAQLNLGIALYNEAIELMSQQKFEDAEKRFNGSETHLREAVRLKLPGPSAHYYLGMMLIKFKAYEDAQKELELAISNGGENLALAHKFLGGVYMSTHKNKEAADELEKYLKLEPKAPDAEKIKASIKDLRKQ